MPGSRPRLRLLGIALAAIVGVLSMAGGASASQAKAAPGDDARACCLMRACDACCCEPTKAPTRSEPAGWAELPMSAEAGLAAPARPCECRSGEPAAPASRPEPRSPESRPDHDRCGPVGLIFDAPRPAIAAVRPTPLDSGPTKTPLYLRTARLLI